MQLNLGFSLANHRKVGTYYAPTALPATNNTTGIAFTANVQPGSNNTGTYWVDVFLADGVTYVGSWNNVQFSGLSELVNTSIYPFTQYKYRFRAGLNIIVPPTPLTNAFWQHFLTVTWTGGSSDIETVLMSISDAALTNQYKVTVQGTVASPKVYAESGLTGFDSYVSVFAEEDYGVTINSSGGTANIFDVGGHIMTIQGFIMNQSNPGKYCTHIDSSPGIGPNVIVRNCKMTSTGSANWATAGGLYAGQTIRFIGCDLTAEASTAKEGVLFHGHTAAESGGSTVGRSLAFFNTKMRGQDTSNGAAITIQTITRTVGSHTVNVGATGHGLLIGENFIASLATDPTLNGTYTVLAGGFTANAFTYTTTATTAVTSDATIVIKAQYLHTDFIYENRGSGSTTDFIAFYNCDLRSIKIVNAGAGAGETYIYVDPSCGSPMIAAVDPSKVLTTAQFATFLTTNNLSISDNSNMESVTTYRPTYLELATNWMNLCIARGDTFTAPMIANINSMFQEAVSKDMDIHCDFMMNFAGYSAIQQTQSLFGNFVATAGGTGTPTLTPGTGTVFSGANWWHSNFIPSVNGHYYTLNNACVGYKRIGGALTDYNAFFMIAQASKEVRGLIRGGAADIYYGINDASGAIRSGVFVNQTSIQQKRTSASSVTLLYDASTFTDNAISSSALNTIEFYIGASNSNGTAGLLCQNTVGLRHVYAGDSSLVKGDIDTMIANFISRM